jgi:hypothetical protein
MHLSPSTTQQQDPKNFPARNRPPQITPRLAPARSPLQTRKAKTPHHRKTSRELAPHFPPPNQTPRAQPLDITRNIASGRQLDFASQSPQTVHPFGPPATTLLPLARAPVSPCLKYNSLTSANEYYVAYVALCLFLLGSGYCTVRARESQLSRERATMGRVGRSVNSS